MTYIEAIIIAIVEGLTEFLPVSSTGHMIIAEALLGVEETEFVKAFTVIIQFGAILSVVVLYWRRFLFPPVEGEGRSRWQQLFEFYSRLVVAFVPAAIVGVLLGDFIDEMLGSVTVVAVMLVLGGVFMLFVDRLFGKGKDAPITYRRAFMVGVFQCLAALLPGTSRSMCTIVGGMQQGLSIKRATEFSFFLAVPTMFGATVKKVYDLIKAGGVEIFMQDNNLAVLIVGNVVAFIVAMLAIKFFITFIAKYGFKAFGWYRIIVGLLLLLLPLLGVSLKMVS